MPTAGTVGEMRFDMPPEHNRTIDSITVYDTTGELVWNTGTSASSYTYIYGSPYYNEWEREHVLNATPETQAHSPIIDELRNRVAELEKQLEEIKKRIGGGF